jgi:hypothetical protein
MNLPSGTEDAAVVIAARTWKFTPAASHNGPVSFACTVKDEIASACPRSTDLDMGRASSPGI